MIPRLRGATFLRQRVRGAGLEFEQAHLGSVDQPVLVGMEAAQAEIGSRRLNVGFCNLEISPASVPGHLTSRLRGIVLVSEPAPRISRLLWI